MGLSLDDFEVNRFTVPNKESGVNPWFVRLTQVHSNASRYGHGVLGEILEFGRIIYVPHTQYHVQRQYCGHSSTGPIK
jgi:hypothetical protein